MPDDTLDGKPTIFPYLSYRDVDAALEWLSTAFGFQATSVVRDQDGAVMHAEMTFGNGAIMLGTASGDAHSPAVPAEHGVYVYVDDVDAHYKRARASGSTILIEPEDTGWGSRRYRVLDYEGYEWSFGSYRPAIGS
jgi:uncharacterized glyoxalase superfamily protein PhnB